MRFVFDNLKLAYIKLLLAIFNDTLGISYDLNDFAWVLSTKSSYLAQYIALPLWTNRQIGAKITIFLF